MHHFLKKLQRRKRADRVIRVGWKVNFFPWFFTKNSYFSTISRSLSRLPWLSMIFQHLAILNKCPNKSDCVKLTMILWCWLFQLWLKFQLVKPSWDFFWHDKWKQCKNRIVLICRNFIMVKRAEISSRFWSHVNDLKIVV